MPEMEVKQLIEDVNKGVATLRSEMDGLKTRDGETEQKLDRITDDITKKLEAVQKSQAEEKARADALEAALNRMPSGEGDKKQTAEFEEKSRKALEEYMRTGECEGFKIKKDEGIEIRAMSTDVNPDGGYLVRPELANFMIQRIFETSPLRQVANVRTTANKSIEVLIDDDEAEAEWEGEGASTQSDSDTPELGMLEIPTHKMATEPKTTTEELQDAYFDVEAWLSGKVSDKFSRKENTAFFTGNGVLKPRGLLTFSNYSSAGVYERNKIEQIALGHASQVTSDGLIDLQSSLKEGYQGRATWLMKRQSFGQILKLKGADNYYFSPTLLKDGQATLTLLGKRVLFCDDMQAVGAGNLAIAYGDFSVGYTIVDRVGIQVLRDALTSKGYVKFYTTKRVGGAVTNFESIKLGKVATSV